MIFDNILKNGLSNMETNISGIKKKLKTGILAVDDCTG